jgi:hypothetical protein
LLRHPTGSAMQASLRFLNVDVKAAAEAPAGEMSGDLGGERLRRSFLPPQILAFTRYWLKLGGTVAPVWPQFDQTTLADIAPYFTIARCHTEEIFTFTFAGKAIAALLGEDLTGRTVNATASLWGEIDWYRRWKPVAQTAEIQVLSGSTNPPYTAGVEFIGADFPFLRQGGGAVSHVVSVTVARMN